MVKTVCRHGVCADVDVETIAISGVIEVSHRVTMVSACGGDEATASDLRHDRHEFVTESVGVCVAYALSALLVPGADRDWACVVTMLCMWTTSANLLYNFLGVASDVVDSDVSVDTICDCDTTASLDEAHEYTTPDGWCYSLSVGYLESCVCSTAALSPGKIRYRIGRKAGHVAVLLVSLVEPCKAY